MKKKEPRPPESGKERGEKEKKRKRLRHVLVGYDQDIERAPILDTGTPDPKEKRRTTPLCPCFPSLSYTYLLFPPSSFHEEKENSKNKAENKTKHIIVQSCESMIRETKTIQNVQERVTLFHIYR